jgi:sec-independent protein translocase protein TatA
MGSLSPWHLLIVALIVIVVFGSKRLPDTARSLGKSMRILKSETQAMKTDGGQQTQTTDNSTANSSEQPAPKTIQAAPGDVNSSRPVQEPKGTTQS